MAQVCVEIEGSVDEVIGVLVQLGSAGRHATARDAGRSVETPAGGGKQATPVTGARTAAGSHEAALGEWTETLADDFLAGLEPATRRMTLHVWRAGAAGIHRSALCQRAELTPTEPRSLLMRMSNALRRFQRERGMTLSRPVAANSPLQSYCVDPDFAAAATSDMFGERTADRLADGAEHP